MWTTNRIKNWMGRAAGLAAFIVTAGLIAASAQSVPSVVVSSTSSVPTSGTTQVGKVVQDTCGNLYELENGGSLLEVPAGGGAAVDLTLPSPGLVGNSSRGLAIDSQNNLYVGGMAGNWSGGHLWRIPSTNCAPQVSAATDLYSSVGSLGALSYWSSPNGATTDAAGNVYLSTGISCCTSTPNWIVQITPGGTAVAVVSNFANTISSLAADSSGDVFFTSGSQVYEVAFSGGAFAANPTSVIATGLNTPSGLAFDAQGNLYVDDSATGSIYEVPFAMAQGGSSASLQFDSRFLIASGLPIGSPITTSQDGKSFFFGNGDTNVYQQALGSASFGGITVGKSATASIEVAFNASVTPGAFSVSPNGSPIAVTSETCAAGQAYSAGSSCSLTVKFTPSAPGLVTAGAIVDDSNGNVLATQYLSGTGIGAGVTLDPGSVTAFGGGFKTPMSVAIDSAGDTFYADAGLNQVLEFKAGSTTGISVGEGLSKPSGVAVDGAGNVFIADTGNSRIVEVPVLNGALSNSAQVVLVDASELVAKTALNEPAGITADQFGNLYIADTGNNRIVYLPYIGGWSAANASVLMSGLTGPLATTVDTNGNLYVANSGAGQIYKLLAPFSQGVQELVAVGFGNPSALAIDASNSLFVIDEADGTIERIPNISGNLDPNQAVELGAGISGPYGAAVDASGNLYVSSSSSGSAYWIGRSTITVAFGNWGVGTTGGPLAVQLENEGNASLTFATPYYSASGDTSAFSIDSSDSAACADGSSVAPGAGCEVVANFNPAATGAFSEALTIASNASNSASEQIVLNGNGVTPAPTKTTLTITAPTGGVPFFGEPISLSASVSASNGTATGMVTLLVDGSITATASLNSSGVATFSLASGLTGGDHSLMAIYNGASSFNGSVSPALSLSVSKAPTATTLTVVTPFTDPLSVVQGNSVGLTAVISSTGVGIPTGSVTFTSNGTTIATVPVVPASGGIFEATYQSSSLAVGSNAIAANYAGDANYIASASAASKVTVVSGATMQVTPSGTSITASQSGIDSITFTAVSYGGWTGVVGFSCDPKSLPADTLCVFSPGQATVFANTTGTTYPPSQVKLSLAINQPPTPPTASGMVWWIAGPTGLLLLLMRRRMKAVGLLSGKGVWLLIVSVGALSAGTLGISACGSSTSFQTPKGTSTVNVIASSDPYQSGSTTTTQPCSTSATTCVQQSFKVSVTVQ